VNEHDPPPRPAALDYAGPSTLRGRPVLGVIVAILGVCVGSFGALTLSYGVVGIVYVFTRSNRRDFAGDLFETVMFLLIGIVCLYVAFRWCRAARAIVVGR
jgi:hypothetical protein